MVYNKIYVAFGASRTAKTLPINYIDDVKQVLVIRGLTLPEYYVVDFCNEGDSSVIPITATSDGAEIPDALFTSGKPIKAYIVVSGNEGDVQTRYEIKIPVNYRPNRQDVDPTDPQQKQIDALVAALNDGVSRAESAADEAEQAAELLESPTANATTLEPDEDATASYVNGVFSFGIPKGKKGDKLTYADLTEEDKAELVQGPILEAQTEAVNAVNAAGTTNVNSVNSAGTTQVDNVNQAGATQVQAVEDKGEEVIKSIPADYTELDAKVTSLNQALTDITGNSVIPVTGEGKYIVTSGATANINSPVNDARYRYYVASAVPGDMFTINAQGGSSPRTWAFVAEDGTVLSKSLASANCVDLVIKAPENSAYLVINSLRNDFSYYGQLLSLANVGLFGDDLAVSFTAETVQIDTANLLARRILAKGKYILRWRQVDNVQKHSINSRLGPLYKNANGQSTIYYDKFHTPWKSGVNYWIIDITSEEEYRFYMWGSDLSADCAITEFNLFDANTPIGKIYLSLAENAAQKEKARFAPTMFKTIGFIGDSWTAGSIYDANSSYIGTYNDYSYGSQMARGLGATPTFFAKGGLSAREWITDSEGLPKLLNSPVQDMYWVNLGINDAGEITEGTESGVGAPSDYDNGVTGTFCYYMGQTIESIQAYAPNAVIVLCDILQLSANQIVVSNAIPMIADYYGLPYVRMYDDDFYRSEANHLLMRGAHPTILLHSGMAQANLRLLSACVDSNTDKFNTFIPA